MTSSTLKKSQDILFTPGPVMMEEEVKQAGGKQAPYFRNLWFSQLVLRCEKQLLELVQAPKGSRVAFVGGSGTMAMEAAIINFISPQEKIGIIVGGKFGHRFTEIADCHHIPYEVLKVDRDPLSDCHALSIFSEDIKALYLNAHETSIGHLYNTHSIGQYSKKHNWLFVVDAISLFGTDRIDMANDNIDILIMSSNKGLGLSPGLACLILSPNAQQHILENPPTYYANIQSILKNGIRGQTPFTPPINIFMQLDAKLSHLTKEKLYQDQEHAKRLAQQFRKGVKDLPFKPYCLSMPNAFTALEVTDPSLDIDALLPILERDYHIILTPIKHLPAGARLLCVSHMGHLSFEDNQHLIDALNKILGGKKKA